MLEDKNYRILEMHICSFERKDNILSFDMNKYPERLCVHDKVNKIVVDVETYHQYPYIKVLNMQYFYDLNDAKLLTPSKRVGCMEYATIPYNLDKRTLRSCRTIIRMLQSGKIFPDGNEILTNEQYLEMINSSENINKTKKMVRKRK